MNVILAENSGACYGVERALNIAEQAATSGEEVSTLGALIHNPIVVDDLARRGVHAVDEPAQVTTQSVIIRSHGVSPEIIDELNAAGKTIVDATCPYVARAQNAAASLGRQHGTVVVIGEAGHPEVSSIMAHAHRTGAEVIVCSGPDDVPANLAGDVGVVVQTTQTEEVLSSVVAALRSLDVQPDIRNTICRATRQRQQSARELSERVDAMVVIGGRNSANTTRLARICAEKCPSTHHIERTCDIDPDWFAPDTLIGVTAGASTPESQILDVVDFLKGL